MRILHFTLCASLSLMTGCASVKMQTVADGESPLVVGPAVRTNTTPLTQAYLCYNAKLAASKQLAGGKKLQIAVGEIKDYTGKVSDTEGAAVTQGASLMLFSALNKLKDSVNLHDRFDTRVTDLELKYIGLKQLGDGKTHEVSGQTVPWFPYFGGSVKKSDFTILGGITELNYNIQSGGAEFRVDQVGPAARIYTMSVAADLRLVNTQTLEVVSAVSLQKQFSGFEVGFEIFRFFGVNGTDRLFDVNIGNKSQEPLQLGIRAILEESALQLIAEATGVHYSSCMSAQWSYPNTPPVTPQPPRLELTAEPAAIKQGASTRLGWNVQDSSDCSLAPGIGSVKGTGTMSVAPLTSTTYTLSCKGKGGQSERQVLVQVIQPPPDTDKDGVPDASDQCPNTPVGTKVDQVGCRIPVCTDMRLDIGYTTNSTEIRERDYDELSAVADALKATPQSSLIIEGHTDDVGDEGLNMRLSQQRTDTVKGYLARTYGIEARRIETKGYGESSPIDTNATEDGRLNNRRTAFQLCK